MNDLEDGVLYIEQLYNFFIPYLHMAILSIRLIASY